MALPLRHELKYFIARPQYEVLSRTLKGALKLDANAVRHGGSYHIRSLYFDTVFDDALYADKLAALAAKSPKKVAKPIKLDVSKSF